MFGLLIALLFTTLIHLLIFSFNLFFIFSYLFIEGSVIFFRYKSNNNYMNKEFGIVLFDKIIKLNMKKYRIYLLIK